MNYFKTLWILISLVFVACNPEEDKKKDLHYLLTEEKLFEYLLEKRDKNGVYKSVSCADAKLTKSCQSEPTLFDSYIIYRNLFKLKDRYTFLKDKKYIQFKETVSANKFVPNLWKFGLKNNHRHSELPPDLDDTANALLFYEEKVVDTSILRNNRNSEKYFNTWVPDTSDDNNFDCSVNLNVLYYLERDNENEQTFLKIIKKFEKNELDQCNMFYIGQSIPHYFLYETAKKRYPHLLKEVVPIISNYVHSNINNQNNTIVDKFILFGFMRIVSLQDSEYQKVVLESLTNFSPTAVYFDISGQRYYGTEQLNLSFLLWALHLP